MAEKIYHELMAQEVSLLLYKVVNLAFMRPTVAQAASGIPSALVAQHHANTRSPNE